MAMSVIDYLSDKFANFRDELNERDWLHYNLAYDAGEEYGRDEAYKEAMAVEFDINFDD